MMVATLAMLAWIGSFSRPAIAAPREAPQPQMVATLKPLAQSTPDRLAPPPTVYPPTQADQGAQVYYLVCMVCHGDRGQGLTQEWRDVVPPPDNDCWRSGCHAAHHPVGGFEFPHEVPAVRRPNILASFGSAAAMHDFIQSKMPWQAPGSLKPDEYWQLTAFLIRLNGYNLGTRILDAQSAAQVDFSGKPAGNNRPAPWLIGMIALALALLVTGGVIVFRRRKRMKAG